MKIGLDIHGVIDTNPAYFAEFTKTMIAAGHEIHVITGPSKAKVIPQLEQMGITYTHLFSIIDSVDQSTIRWDNPDNPWIDDETWDSAKGRYCQEHGIDLHMDDSDVYGKYFKTPYARFYGSKK